VAIEKLTVAKELVGNKVKNPTYDANHSHTMFVKSHSSILCATSYARQNFALITDGMQMDKSRPEYE
jgi:hypothetical protein